MVFAKPLNHLSAHLTVPGVTARASPSSRMEPEALKAHEKEQNYWTQLYPPDGALGDGTCVAQLEDGARGVEGPREGTGLLDATVPI